MSEQVQESSSAPAPDSEQSSLPLIIPEGIRYNCQGCGRCCSGWAVGLTEEDWVKVKDVDWGSLHPELSGKELFVHREEECKQGLSMYPHFTQARADGTCPFLIDSLCFIHGHLGESEKPRNCQLFPYTFTPTPDGIYVGLVYNSMASVRNLGNLLTEQKEMLANMWKTSAAQERARGLASDAVYDAAVKASDLSGIRYEINLVNGLPLTWEEYLKIEAPLTSTIQSGKYPTIAHALLAGSELLAEAVRLKREGQDLSALSEFQPEIAQWINGTPTGAELLVFRTLYFKNFEWPQIRKQFSQQWQGTQKSVLSEPKVISAGMQTILWGGVTLSTPKKVNINKVRLLPTPPFSKEVDDFFRRYFFLKLFSKTYCGSSLSGFSVVAGFNHLVGNFLCSIIYAKAHAMLRSEQEIKMSDLYEAYFLIDKEVVQLSQLPKDKAVFYDMGFSSPRLLCRLVGEMCGTVLQA